ncbi:MAG: tagaturonate reductase [Eubacterium sp.]|nr:tagaturonate reductase [Eubacterium sp.]
MTDICKNFPIKILQFGEGNFLRAFADYYIQLANEKGIYNGSVAVCQPRTNTKIINALKNQDCKYNVIIRGRFNGEIIDEVKEINSISRAIDTVGEYDSLLHLIKSDSLETVISNTTEAGICFNESDKMENSPDISFPAKVTALLYERYKSGKSGLVFLPVELIENNGDTLRDCIIKYVTLWELEEGFADYVKNDCSFCNTLVDRIVTGHIDYEDDKCAVACEPYASFLIQADERAKIALPFNNLDKNISFVDDLQVYRSRKVRILNGAHTMSVLAAYHMGFDIVRDMMQDDLTNAFIKKGLFDEVIPTIDLPADELTPFANSVLERFNNPFIDHKILDISLNSVSKFKARCLCTLLDYKKITGKLPRVICFGLAALINFYNGKYAGDKFVGKRNSETYEINDSKDVLDFFGKAYKGDDVVKAVLSNKAFWDIDLTEIDGLYDTVKKYFDNIKTFGMRNAVEMVVYDEYAF